MAKQPKPAAAEAPALRTYQVSLSCPTPLRENPALVEARDEDEAWDAFQRLNGISGSEHPKQVVVA